ncbi:MAG: ethanolamine ammonia-lyase reactivating factor EutA, partial [Chloroflexi bacterium]|nr:ethanolamine ammonia-lyase reactivating factor EutA [Chloroflexota bacterium]
HDHHHGHDHHHEHEPAELSALARDLMLTPELHVHDAIDAITFSGGVSEYIYGSENRSFGDLAQMLAQEVLRRESDLPAPVRQAGERIRATVIGASQFTVQVSGNTIAVSDPEVLPMRNLQVIYPRLPRQEDIAPEQMASAIERAHRRLDLTPGEQQVALAVDWRGTPRYQLLRQLAQGIADGLRPSIAAGHPLVLVFREDFGNLVGGILRDEFGVTNDVVSIDGIELNEFDFIDIGEVLHPANAVPVVVKSLVFPAAAGVGAEILA